MTDGLQLAGPVMGRRTSLDANEAPRQTCEKLQHPGPADPLADHHRAQPINPVNLEHRLRYIQTNRDNLAHGRLPSKWFASAQPPYGTPMPQSGRRPQHQKRKSRPRCPMSAPHVKADIEIAAPNLRYGPQPHSCSAAAR